MQKRFYVYLRKNFFAAKFLFKIKAKTSLQANNWPSKCCLSSYL